MLLVVASGCSDRSGKAVVDDYPGGGYKIVLIDGMPPERASGAVATMVPYVLLKPGTHAFKAVTLHEDGQFAFSATVNANRKYRVVPAADGNITLADVTPPANSN